ncbi:hypothetical protein KIN20_028635 [Parelaphostrongylus tenuis]|uniref:Uncharacterized protein n=1 Tax=Parelaphostrongylus tenuis TaxID=148309 RepID=A0AAD5R130_PARTN|nr:hypothetical protein KIN20_028635 [Parelaphostrongylus tenuis]
MEQRLDCWWNATALMLLLQLLLYHVDALRQKLEGKNQQMEQRDRRIKRLEGELVNIKGS